MPCISATKDSDLCHSAFDTLKHHQNKVLILAGTVLVLVLISTATVFERSNGAVHHGTVEEAVYKRSKAMAEKGGRVPPAACLVLPFFVASLAAKLLFIIL